MASKTMTKRVLKFSFDGDLRRRKVDVPLTFQDLVKLFEASFHLKNINPRDYRVEYVDDENDVITVTNDDEVAELFNFHTAMNKCANVRLAGKDQPEGKSQNADEVPKDQTQRPVVHRGYYCDATGQKPITGPRYHLRGSNYDLCEAAFEKLSQVEKAKFEKIVFPSHWGSWKSGWKQWKQCPKDHEKKPVEHVGFTCDVTGQCPITGPRYHLRGSNYDLCEAAFEKLSQEEKDKFRRIDFPCHWGSWKSGWKRWHQNARCSRNEKRWWRVAKQFRQQERKDGGAGKKVDFKAKFVSDSSVPDASVFEAGKAFTKTWRLKGFWPNGCNIMLVGGEPLAAIPRHEIPENKGEEIEVSVDMQSPLQPGRFKSFWRLVDKTGKRFGDKLWADIVVVTKAADAEEPEEKNDIKPEAKFVADVSIPDETVLEEGQLFTKTWRLKGSWPRGCGISFVGGENFAEQKLYEIAENKEGGEVEVSIDMRSPTKPGHYFSYWRLVDASGKQFGNKYWADIMIVSKNESVDVEVVELKENVEVVELKENVEVSAPLPSAPAVAVGLYPTIPAPYQYQNQLSVLLEMGFDDDVKNKGLLNKHEGNLAAVCAALLQ